MNLKSHVFTSEISVPKSNPALCYISINITLDVKNLSIHVQGFAADLSVFCESRAEKPLVQLPKTSVLLPSLVIT
jgi:hypothetical protein